MLQNKQEIARHLQKQYLTRTVTYLRNLTVKHSCKLNIHCKLIQMVYIVHIIAALPQTNLHTNIPVFYNLTRRLLLYSSTGV